MLLSIISECYKKKLGDNYGELSDYYNAIQMDPKYVVA